MRSPFFKKRFKKRFKIKPPKKSWKFQENLRFICVYKENFNFMIIYIIENPKLHDENDCQETMDLISNLLPYLGGQVFKRRSEFIKYEKLGKNRRKNQ